MASAVDIIVKTETPSADEFAVVQSSLENDTTPLHVRVRMVPWVAKNIVVSSAALPKVVAALVRLLDEDVMLVHTTVVAGLVDLCKAVSGDLDSAKLMEVVRDAADVLFQITLPSSGFSPEVRKAARDAIANTLPTVSVLGVAVKAVHLLSNDRWNDEEKQLEHERKGALDLLAATVSPAKAALWSEEDETKLLKFVSVLLPVVSSSEMNRLLAILGQLPNVASKEGQPVVDMVFSKLKLDTARGLETVTKLRTAFPKDRTITNDVIVDKVVTQLNKAKSSEPLGTQVAKTFAAIAKYSSAEKAAKHIVTAKNIFMKAGDESFTFVEAILTGIAALASKNQEAFAEIVQIDDVQAKLQSLAASASTLEAKLSFAVAKLALSEPASAKQNEAIACLKRIVQLAVFLGEKKVPEVRGASWEVRNASPAGAKRTKPSPSLDAPLAPKQLRKPQPGRR